MDPQSLIMMELMNATVGSAAPGESSLAQWLGHLPWLHSAEEGLSMLSVFSDPRHMYAMCVSCKAL